MPALDAKLTTAAAVVGLIVALGGTALLLRPADRFPNSPDRTVPSLEAQKSAPPVPVLRAQEVLVAINGSRAHEGLTPLVLDARLTAAARDKLADMLRRHYFDHKTPDGKYIWDLMVHDKCDYGLAAENLARGFSDEVEMERSWMRSAQHRENILNKRYRLTGIAVSQDPPTAVVLFADTCG
jgi:uncharacterized protein YkwD